MNDLLYEWRIEYKDGSTRQQFDAQGKENSRLALLSSDPLEFLKNARILSLHPRCDMPQPFNQVFGTRLADGDIPVLFRRVRQFDDGTQFLNYFIGRKWVSGNGELKQEIVVVSPPVQIVCPDPNTGELRAGPLFPGAVEVFDNTEVETALDRWLASSPAS